MSDCSYFSLNNLGTDQEKRREGSTNTLEHRAFLKYKAECAKRNVVLDRAESAVWLHWEQVPHIMIYASMTACRSRFSACVHIRVHMHTHLHLHSHRVGTETETKENELNHECH